jgi:hypothetical protein
LDVNNAIRFITILGAVLITGGLWELFKPYDIGDIDACAYSPKSIEDLPN